MEILTGDTINISEWAEFYFTIYAGIGKIILIRQKEILEDELEFRIW